MRRVLRLLTAVFAISAMAAACGDLGPTAPVDAGGLDANSSGFIDGSG